MKRLLVLLLAVLPLTTWGQSFVFERFTTAEGLSDNNVQWVLPLADGRMMVQTWRNVNIYDGGRMVSFPRDDERMAELPHHRWDHHVAEDDSLRLWIKEWGRLWCLDLRTGQQIREPLTRLRADAIDVYFDSRRRIWLLTNDSVVGAGRSYELPVPAASVAYVAAKGDVPVVFDIDGGVSLPEGSGWRHYECALVAEKNEWWYFRVIEGKDGKFYRLASAPGFSSIDLFDTNTKQWQPVLSAAMVLYAISQPEHGRLFVGSRHGLIEIDLNAQPSNIGIAGKLPASVQSPFPARLLTTFRIATPNGITTVEGNTGIANICRDRQGGWWMVMGHLGVFYTHPSRYSFEVGTAGELGIPDSKLDESHRRVKALWQYHQQPDNDIVTDSRSRKWRATHRGVIVGDGADSLLLTTADGLPSNYILTLCVDKKDRVWAGTNNGICCIGDSLHVATYDADDGLPQWEMSERTAVRLDDGRIAIGCVEGWIAFHPDSVQHPHFDLTPMLSDLQVEGLDSLPAQPPYLTHLQLRHDQNNITVAVSALHYAFNRSTHYSWRLRQSEADEWHDGTSNTDTNGSLRLSFMHLSPGDYTLEVQASDDGLRYSPAARLITLTVLPPWWQTWWAYTLYILCALALTAIAVWTYMRRKLERLNQQHREEMLLKQIEILLQQTQLTIEQPQQESESEQEAEEDDEPSISAEDAAFVQDAISQVERHLKESYSVEQLAKDLCMERTGLYKCLTAIVNQSPQTVIRSIRLNHAATMLRSGATVTETSDACGFSSISYFSRAFTKEFGVSPSEYVKQ